MTAEQQHEPGTQLAPAVIQGTVVERLVHAKRHPVVAVWLRDDVTRRAAARLAELRPDFYRGWDAAAVGDALRVRGIEPGQMWGQTDDGQGANRRGVTREQITAASGTPARSSGTASGEEAP